MDQTISLQDGRQLGFCEYGDPDGYPLFLFHGVPGSRYQRPSETITRSRGIRLIVLERPGFGLSPIKRGRTLVDWADDVRTFADLLKIDDFGVLGLSAGGPYALACARKIQERISSVFVISGLGQIDTPGSTQLMPFHEKWLFSLGKQSARTRMKALIEVLRGLTAILLHNPQRYLPVLARFFPQEERPFFKKAEDSRMFLKDIGANYTSGSEGIVDDLMILSKPWDFDPGSISGKVHFWHGDRDLIAPLFLIEKLAKEIPASKTRIIQGEGHLLIFRYWDSILEEFNRFRTKRDSAPSS
ncbi:MAG: alpha/beta fold hydrolase [Leptospirillum sp.]